MSQIRRMVFSIEGVITAGFAAIMWVWAQPYLGDVVNQFEGPFSSTWDTLNLVVPVTIGAYYIIYIGYVIWGPVEQERARQTARRGP
jgi:hypothetical protein